MKIFTLTTLKPSKADMVRLIHEGILKLKEISAEPSYIVTCGPLLANEYNKMYGKLQTENRPPLLKKSWVLAHYKKLWNDNSIDIVSCNKQGIIWCVYKIILK